jgi:hypothetical protein
MKYTLGLFITLLVLVISPFVSGCQTNNINVRLEPIEIPNLDGVQSYVIGQHEGKWLILGGRLDGLHMKQPFASFSADGNNLDITVVDPISKEVWRTTNQSLSANLKEQLSSSNMQFFQEGNTLYTIGGYGYSDTNQDHITYPFLTAIDVEGLMNAIINGTSINSYFRQVEDNQMAVTGGYLSKIENTYYLVGGQKFTGRYNPMGPDHGPGFLQEYTNEIRQFNINDNGTSLLIEHINTSHDEMHLHRRDYNLSSVMMNDNDEGLIAFSGVFQNTADVPWLYPVVIDNESYTPVEAFTQHYNHYHCANASFYSKEKQFSSVIFFGGIAQFYDEDGVLVQDNDVPFVNTIAAVNRDNEGNFSETLLKAKMPGLLGASAEFILAEDAPLYKDDIINLDAFDDNETHIGYIYGGINSSEPNIFWINTGEESIASPVVYKVYLSKTKTTGLNDFSGDNREIKMQIYPNPASNIMRIVVDMPFQSDIKIAINSLSGNKILSQTIEKNNVILGKNYFNIALDSIISGEYIVRLQTNELKTTQKLVVND